MPPRDAFDGRRWRIGRSRQKPSHRREYAISCVMDSHPKFRRQTFIWIASLNACDATRVFQPYVHYIRPQPEELLRALERMGAILIEVSSFGKGPAAYCNKLMQLPTFNEAGFKEVVLSDTDIAFVCSPEGFLGTNAVRAKIVDHPNPEHGVLAELLKRAGFEGEALTARADFSPGQTHPLNCNGGL